MERVSGVGAAVVSAQDPARLGQWYADQLGAETDASANGVMVRADAGQPGDTDGTTWSVSFDVDDLDAMVAQLRAAGATVNVDPATPARGGVAWVRDPEGNLIRLVESTSTDRVWSSEPDAVRVLGDEPEPERRSRGVWRRRTPWLALLLVGVLAVAIIMVRQQTGADQAEPAPEPGPTDQDASVVDVGEPVLGVTADWELIARGQNTVSRIEFAEGRVTTTQLPQFDGSGPVSLLTGPDWTIVRPVDDALGYLVSDGQPARMLQGALGGGGQMFPGPGPNQVWVEDTDGDSGYLPTFTLYTVAGEHVGPSFYAPATGPAASDHAGHVLVHAAGGTYLMRPGLRGPRRVTTGKVDGVSADHFLVTECDERARCKRVVISRDTGQRRTIERQFVDPFVRPQYAIAPDGSIAAIRKGQGKLGEVSITDLATGRERRTGAYIGSGLVFSPDSEWLFAIEADGDVVAIDTDTFDVHDVDVPLPETVQLAVRSAG
ncbi:VOC family protein [Haloechinothrix halophila]|uniref:VOC family protein n=1 Tax=Haloechinothrix halophila TaxID=1069073 RepID=UPI00041DDB64|nr:VOC family protein [Haloechinothrix halophila]